MNKIYITEKLKNCCSVEGFKKTANTPVEIIFFDDLCEGMKKAESDLPNCDRIVFINEDGIAPFMYFSKIKGIVASATYDEHSAYMTPLHNNTKILCTGYEIVTMTILKSIIEKYFATPYEGARHKARIDMLNAELETE